MFLKLSEGSETLNMTFMWLGEMFEGDFADMCAEKFPLVSMWCWAEGLAWADPGAKTPIGISGNFQMILPESSSLIQIFRWYCKKLFLIPNIPPLSSLLIFGPGPGESWGSLAVPPATTYSIPPPPPPMMLRKCSIFLTTFCLYTSLYTDVL